VRVTTRGPVAAPSRVRLAARTPSAWRCRRRRWARGSRRAQRARSAVEGLEPRERGAWIKGEREHGGGGRPPVAARSLRLRLRSFGADARGGIEASKCWPKIAGSTVMSCGPRGRRARQRSRRQYRTVRGGGGAEPAADRGDRFSSPRAVTESAVFFSEGIQGQRRRTERTEDAEEFGERIRPSHHRG